MFRLKATLLIVGALPSLCVLVLSYLEGLYWALSLTLVTGALFFGLMSVLVGIKIWENVTTGFTTKKESERISEQIAELSESEIREIDAGTAATIWSGARDEDSTILWYIRFRLIKSAIDDGEIQPVRLNGDRANLRTWLSVSDLQRFFVTRGIMEVKSPKCRASILPR